MRERARPAKAGAVVVAVMMLTAGCNALVPGEAEPTVDGTVTPAPVETPAATAAATPEPSGFDWLVENGTVDVRALFEAHTETLSGYSFTLNWTRRAEGGAGPLADDFVRYVRVADNKTFLRYNAGDTYPGEVRTYTSENDTYRQVTDPNGTTSATAGSGQTSRARVRYAVLGASIVELMVPAENAAVRYQDRGSTGYAVLVSTTAPEYLRALYGDYDVENFTATVWVHPDRYVRSLYYEFSLVGDDERVDVAERYAYYDVGATTVERPSWAAKLAASDTATPAPDNGTAPPGTGTGTGTATATPAAGTQTPTE